MAFDHAGNVYVADSTQNRIQKFDQDGTFIMAWGSSSTSKEAAPAPGNFLHPAALAFDSQDNIYVVDSGNNRVQKFDKQGHFLLEWGSSGTADGQFAGPGSVVIDSHDNVYVSDFGVRQGKGLPPKDAYIQKFDSQGHFIQKWTPLPPTDGSLKLAIDQQDNLYVLSRYNQDIQKYNKQGQFLLKWDAKFTSITVSPQGQIYLGGDTSGKSAHSAAYNVFRYAADGQFLGQLNLQPKLAVEPFASISEIAVDQQGYIYVLDSSQDLVHKFDQAGRFQMVWSAGESKKPNEFVFLSSIAVDSAGNVYVAQFGKHQIFKYDNQGNLLAHWPVLVGAQANFGEPLQISVDNQGHLFVAVFEILDDQGTSQPKIIKYDSQGHLLGEWGGSGADKGQFGQISALAVDQADHVFVADFSKNGPSEMVRIQKFDGQGNFLEQWSGGASQIGVPSGMSFNKEGHIYVSDAGEAKIVVFDQQWHYLSSLAEPGRANGQVYRPTSLVLTADIMLLVADTGNNRVQKFRLH